MNKDKNLTSLDELLDEEYGEKGTVRRNNFERRAKAFLKREVIKNDNGVIHVRKMLKKQ
jgi:hypothetical protein